MTLPSMLVSWLCPIAATSGTSSPFAAKSGARRAYGDRCWELDAMDPNDLRECIESAIAELIEPVAWKRCEIVNKAEQESLRGILQKWGKSRSKKKVASSRSQLRQPATPTHISGVGALL